VSRLPVKKYGKLRYRLLSHLSKAHDLEKELEMILINQKPDNIRSYMWSESIWDLSFNEGDHFGLSHQNLLESIEWLKEDCADRTGQEGGEA
tara:strand:- start:16 stop:291 length:276 start_codon:yes stop_codon:yes gene_type:complete